MGGHRRTDKVGINKHVKTVKRPLFMSRRILAIIRDKLCILQHLTIFNIYYKKVLSLVTFCFPFFIAFP